VCTKEGYGILSIRKYVGSKRCWPARLRPEEVLLKNLLAVIILGAGLLASCTLPASKPPVVYMTREAPGITIDRVQVNQGAGIYVAGRSTLPDGECVQTELLADEKVLEWWPREVCVEIASRRWEILAALGRQGAPERLDPNAAYEIHAWNPKAPTNTSTRFPFDLNGSTQ
jgi:hypothetical protein